MPEEVSRNVRSALRGLEGVKQSEELVPAMYRSADAMSGGRTAVAGADERLSPRPESSLRTIFCVSVFLCVTAEAGSKIGRRKVVDDVLNNAGDARGACLGIMLNLWASREALGCRILASSSSSDKFIFRSWREILRKF